MSPCHAFIVIVTSVWHTCSNSSGDVPMPLEQVGKQDALLLLLGKWATMNLEVTLATVGIGTCLLVSGPIPDLYQAAHKQRQCVYGICKIVLRHAQEFVG